MPVQIGYAHRQAPLARRGMVAACHPLASLAGVEVLKAGGNVIDAAIATNKQALLPGATATLARRAASGLGHSGTICAGSPSS